MDIRSKSGALKSESSKSRPRWAAHTRIGNVREYLPGFNIQQHAAIVASVITGLKQHFIPEQTEHNCESESLNPRSRRRVPIHYEIMPLGLITFKIDT